jgi:hypothetical protein
MHLIHVDSFKLHEFFGTSIPNYAILSHTWGTDEVSFQDMQAGAFRTKLGFEKINYTCTEARKRGLRWAWVDTCCVDKTSSAELTEAINSMYRWYQESTICFAYLTDVPGGSDLRNEDSPYRRSRWFTRGWTLQELIAPAKVDFYGQGWSFLGDRLILCSLISSITGIPHKVLLGGENLGLFSVAQRMSWASKRQTTRTEDTAYCLLGIFDINMPLLYGEGSKAFQRLQEEILKQTDDQSLFAWTVSPHSLRAWTLAGVLAESPAEFLESADVLKLHKEMGEPSTLTKKGVQMHAYVGDVAFPETSHFHNYCQPLGDRGPRLALIALNCSSVLSARNYVLVMRTDPEDIGFEGASFTRILAPGLRQVAESPVYKDRLSYSRIFITTKATESRPVVSGIHFHGIPLSLDPEGTSRDSWSLRPWAKADQSRLPGTRRSLQVDATFKYLKFNKDSEFIAVAEEYRNKQPDLFVVPFNKTSAASYFRRGRAAFNLYSVEGTTFETSMPWRPIALLCGAWNATEGGWSSTDKKGATTHGQAGTLITFALCPYELLVDGYNSFAGGVEFHSINPGGRAGLLAKVNAKCGDTLIVISVHREHYSNPLDDIAQQEPHFIFIFERERVERSSSSDAQPPGASAGADSSDSAQDVWEWSELWLPDQDLDGELFVAWKYDFIAGELLLT